MISFDVIIRHYCGINQGRRQTAGNFWGSKGKLWRGKTFLFTLMKMTELNDCIDTIYL